MVIKPRHFKIFVYFHDGKTMYCTFQNDSLISGIKYLWITSIFQWFIVNPKVYSYWLPIWYLFSLVNWHQRKHLLLINKCLINWCAKLSGRLHRWWNIALWRGHHYQENKAFLRIKTNRNFSNIKGSDYRSWIIY